MWKPTVKRLEQLNLWAIILWVAGILYACFTPNEQMPQMHFFAGFDKLMHFSFYAVLIFLLLAYRLQRKGAAWIAALQIVLVAALGVVVEHVQRASGGGRSYSLEDMLANGLGLLFGVLCFVLLEKALARYLRKLSN